jgi:hypothetical protein
MSNSSNCLLFRFCSCALSFFSGLDDFALAVVAISRRPLFQFLFISQNLTLGL